MSGYVCKIERLQNGFEVELTDPAIVKANEKRSTKGMSITPWKDPKVSYAFKTVDEVCAFLKKNLETAMPMDEYSSAFDEASSEEDDDD